MNTTASRGVRVALVLGLALALVAPSQAFAAVTFPTLTTAQTVTGFNQITNIVSPQDGTGRLFVTEKPGVIRVIKGGTLLGGAPVLDIRDLVNDAGERGLIGLAFPRDFATKQRAYIYYIDNAGRSVINRVWFHSTDRDRMVRSSMQRIATIAQTSYTNHKGGQMLFGSDGYLYIGLGDGGGRGDPNNRAQNKASLLGKILRIEVESRPRSAGYRVPASNPFVGVRGARPEIWALGLRNPWRFSLDVPSGRLFIGDVGQNAVEEIDRVRAGVRGGYNLGWALYEGNSLYKARSRGRGFTWPIHTMNHPAFESVTGGYVYRGTDAALAGTYVFGDFETGTIYGLAWDGTAWVRGTLLDTTAMITTFGVDDTGELWYSDYITGSVNRLAVAP